MSFLSGIFGSSDPPEQQDTPEKCAALLKAVTAASNDLQCPLTEKELAWFDSLAQKRYMRRGKGDVQAAAKEALATLSWRREFKPDAYTISEMEAELKTGRLVFAGLDKLSRPVMVYKKQIPSTGPPELFIRLFYFTLESMARAVQPGKYEFVWIFDLSTNPEDKAQEMSFLKDLLLDSGKYYAEQMSRWFIVDSSTVFQVVFGTVTSFMNSTLSKKTTYITRADFEKDVEAKANLEKYGGYEDYAHFVTNPYVYEDYKQRLLALGWPES